MSIEIYLRDLILFEVLILNSVSRHLRRKEQDICLGQALISVVCYKALQINITLSVISLHYYFITFRGNEGMKSHRDGHAYLARWSCVQIDEPVGDISIDSSIPNGNNKLCQVIYHENSINAWFADKDVIQSRNEIFHALNILIVKIRHIIMSMAIGINNCQNGKTYFNLSTREIKSNYHVWQITSFTPFFEDREENVYV